MAAASAVYSSCFNLLAAVLLFVGRARPAPHFGRKPGQECLDGIGRGLGLAVIFWSRDETETAHCSAVAITLFIQRGLVFIVPSPSYVSDAQTPLI
jgi:hypothetical protein